MLRFVLHAVQRPITWILVTLAVLVGAVGGMYTYGRQEWRAAQAAVRDGRGGDARRRLEWCLHLWPRNVEVHLLAARAARLDLDYEAAEEHLNRCLRLQGGASQAVQLEFLLLRAQGGEADEVAPALLRCVDEKHPQTPIILETLARYYMHHFQLKPAYACLCRWIEETPDAAKPYHWRGWVQERLNNHSRAMEDYQKALELDPSMTLVRLRVAEMLLEDKQPLEALVQLEWLRQQFPQRADVSARLGQCYFLQGRHDEARRLMESAVGELSNDAPLLLHLGKLDVQEDRPEAAERWLRRVLAIDATDTEAYYTLATALNLQGRRGEAAETLKRYERYKATLERLNSLLRDEAQQPSVDANRPAEIGTIFLQISREQLALHWLFEALQRNPAHEPAHRALAEHFDSKGNSEKAQAHRRWLRRPADPPADKNASVQPAR